MPGPYTMPLLGRGIASPSRRMLRTAGEEITRSETSFRAETLCYIAAAAL
jgi:hypothetical protein